MVVKKKPQRTLTVAPWILCGTFYAYRSGTFPVTGRYAVLRFAQCSLLLFLQNETHRRVGKQILLESDLNGLPVLRYLYRIPANQLLARRDCAI